MKERTARCCRPGQLERCAVLLMLAECLSGEFSGRVEALWLLLLHKM
jgi:hypothetical protein